MKCHHDQYVHSFIAKHYLSKRSTKLHSVLIHSIHTNTPTDFHICQMNSRSLVNKLINFQSFVTHQTTIFSMSPRFGYSSYIWQWNITTIYCKDRNSHGGGVLLAVNKKFTTSLISSPTCTNIEVITTHFHVNPEPMAIQHLCYLHTPKL